MEKQAFGHNPGIIWCNSKITTPDLISKEKFSQWYSSKHVPDAIGTGHLQEAYRYESVDSEAAAPFLAIYYAEDVSDLGEKLTGLPMSDDIFPGSHSAWDHVSFDTRFYKVTQIFEREDASDTQPDIVLSAEMTPIDEAGFENWYRQEHLRDGTMIRGWRRTERYELDNALRTPMAPKFLTLLFVDGDGILDEEMAKVGSSPWSQRMVGSMKQMRVGIYRKVSHHKQKL